MGIEAEGAACKAYSIANFQRATQAASTPSCSTRRVEALALPSSTELLNQTVTSKLSDRGAEQFHR